MYTRVFIVSYSYCILLVNTARVEHDADANRRGPSPNLHRERSKASVARTTPPLWTRSLRRYHPVLQTSPIRYIMYIYTCFIPVRKAYNNNCVRCPDVMRPHARFLPASPESENDLSAHYDLYNIYNMHKRAFVYMRYYIVHCKRDQWSTKRDNSKKVIIIIIIV